MLSYVAVFTNTKDGIHITFPDLPGCVSFGSDENDALQQAKDALQLHLCGMEEDNEFIPPSSGIKELALKEELAPNEKFVSVEILIPVLGKNSKNSLEQKSEHSAA